LGSLNVYKFGLCGVQVEWEGAGFTLLEPGVYLLHLAGTLANCRATVQLVSDQLEAELMVLAAPPTPSFRSRHEADMRVLLLYHGGIQKKNIEKVVTEYLNGEELGFGLSSPALCKAVSCSNV
jgi:hypothetical protein